MTIYSSSHSSNHNASNSILDSVLSAHGSARQAFAVGDFGSALMMSYLEDDSELLACSLVMCGAIDKGLSKLEQIDAKSDEALICRAYGLWWRNNKKGAANILARIENEFWREGAAAVCTILEKRSYNVLLLTNTRTLAVSKAVGKSHGINIHTVVVDDNSWIIPIDRLLPPGFKPDLILSHLVFGRQLPAGVFDLDAITIFHIVDPDLALQGQYNDLSQAHMIICPSLHDHDLLSRLYPGRVVVFPGHIIHNDQEPPVYCSEQKDVDIALTGDWFSPHRSEKAGLAYRLAIVNDPNLNIRIHNGHLKNEAYYSLLSRSRLIFFAHRFTGMLTAGTIEALRRGTQALVSEHQATRLITSLMFEELAFMIGEYSDEDLLKCIEERLSESAAITDTFNERAQVIASEVKNVLLYSPDREIRLIKFALVQSIFLQHSDMEGVTNNSVKLHRPTNWIIDPGLDQVSIRSFFKRTDLSQDHKFLALKPDYAKAEQNRIDLVILTNGIFNYFSKSASDDQRLRLIKNAFDLAVIRFPKSITLRFNRGRINWLLGKNSTALDDFHWLDRSIQDGELDLAREEPLSHRIRPLGNLMPYGIYRKSVIKDLQSEDDYGFNTRLVILATVRVYLALHSLQNDRLEEGVRLLRSALSICPGHFPAARELTKALWNNNHGDILHWFYRTVEMYPPYLTELLPIGVDAENRAGNKEQAFTIVKNWAYFVARVEWSDPSSHHIPGKTLEAATPYLDRLHPNIRQLLDKKNIFGA